MGLTWICSWGAADIRNSHISILCAKDGRHVARLIHIHQGFLTGKSSVIVGVSEGGCVGNKY